ncbi:hypothetical protein VOI54_06835 [Tamlana sp. 2201CG12-4]|uniref:P-loop ATPase, Sll1717 family n=1 Tax=Tamlana sp. 2201CG12-4 TaxID=3112582 RepID=UPI002DBF41B1|nr:hypothetical protein [Tamlana sp. 2201CG12-4]MEC3906727.1 hypothetical protein [Tamlana sp. 2201CG12-4]
MQTGFFAYGSQIPSSGESIEEAIKIINDSVDNVNIESWTNLQISGSLIISNILNAIDNCDFFCADLTGINDNVLFEIGYALAKKKPIYLINDVSHADSLRKFNELGLLSTVGYYPYTNTNQIVEGFHKMSPHDPIDRYWDNLTATLPSSFDRKALLVLNSQVETNYNLEITNLIDFYKLPSVIDDASENIVQPISWYLEQLHSVPAVLVQFSSQARKGFETHNSKCSLISGIALGLELKLQIIAEKPYSIPLDFKDLLKKFSNRKECSSFVNDFLESLHEEIAELLINRDIKVKDRRKRTELQNVNFGEAIAEHESNNIYDYYVDTNHTQQLVKNEYNIVVGRKGSGKTATLYYLSEDLSQDVRNNVVLIKPVNFEVDGLISLMEESNSEFEKGFLIETIWKFLIYTEIAKYLYYKTKKKALYALREVENEFLEYVDSVKGVYLTDFSTRLEEQIKVLKENNIKDIGAGNNKEFRLKVSELLHEGSIYKMKEFFSELIPKNHKLIVLIDNLDKSWRNDSKINILSKYILGLLGVSGRIFKELSYVKSKDKKIDFHLTIFLRSDIFKQVISFAREPDKIEVSRLKWEDPEILFRIIEDRFVALSQGEYSTKELWDRFFEPKVEGVLTKDFIIKNIFPRPRDIIYFFKTCKDTAISRGHEIIMERDVIDSLKDYSSWVFKSVLVENGITYKQMEEFMYELMAGNRIVSKIEISSKMSAAGIYNEGDSDVEKFIDHLVSLTIFGRETAKGVFTYEYDVNNAKKIKVLAQKFNSNLFKIHNALISYLECV